MARRDPPADLLSAYTLNGAAALERFFVDDTNNGESTHYVYPAADTTAMIDAAKREILAHQAGRHRPRTVGRTWLLQALATIALRDSKGCVFGSQEPWAESLLVAAGAAHVTTFEYNRLTFEHPSMRTLTVSELQATNAEDAQCDLALSISSFDHDGLGRCAVVGSHRLEGTGV